jgi:hypothetical protein
MKNVKLITLVVSLFLVGNNIFSQSYYSVPNNTIVKWDQTHLPPGDAAYGIYIPSNSTLEVNNRTMIFYPDSKITIDVGGKLKLNNCTLTINSTTSTWAGIEIMGDSNSSQSVLNRSQGYLYINQTTISRTDSQAILVHSGAIVIAYNSNFIFNKISFRFEHYTNPSEPSRSNYSMINYCNFSYDNMDLYYGDDIELRKVQRHIELKGINGLRIIGCTFLGQYERNNISRWYLGVGIYAENSTFTVEKNDDPSTPYLPYTPHCKPDGDSSYFKNIEFGIIAKNCKNTKIRGCSFKMTTRSIILLEDINSLIFDNYFYFLYDKDIQTAIFNIPEFIYLHGSKHFNITGNTFLKQYKYDGCLVENDTCFLVKVVWPNDPTNVESKIHNNYFLVASKSCDHDNTTGLKIILKDYDNPYDSFSNINISCNHFSNYKFSIAFLVCGKGRIRDLGTATESSGNLFYNLGSENYDIYYSPTTLNPPIPNINCYYYYINPSQFDQDGYYLYPGTINNINKIQVSNPANCNNYSPCDYYESIYGTELGSHVVGYKSLTRIVDVEKDTNIDHVYSPQFFYVNVVLTPNPSTSNIILSLSHAITYFENYTITITNSEEDTVYTAVHWGDDTIISIPRDSIGSIGNYHCMVKIDEEADTSIAFQISDSFGLSISPNPAFDYVNISITGNIQYYSQYNVQIYDENNTLVYDDTFSTSQSTIQIPRASIGVDGTYYCHITINSSSIDTSFILDSPKVHVDLSPNPSSSDITLTLSSERYYYSNYTVYIYDENQTQKYFNTYSTEDSLITIPRTEIGCNGYYSSVIYFDNEPDTTINFRLTDTIFVTIYPNPTYGDINITLTGIENYPNYSVVIYDQYNMLKYQQEYSNQQSTILIPGSYMGNPGTYTVLIVVNDQIVYSNFVLLF